MAAGKDLKDYYLEALTSLKYLPMYLVISREYRKDHGEYRVMYYSGVVTDPRMFSALTVRAALPLKLEKEVAVSRLKDVARSLVDEGVSISSIRQFPTMDFVYNLPGCNYHKVMRQLRGCPILPVKRLPSSVEDNSFRATDKGVGVSTKRLIHSVLDRSEMSGSAEVESEDKGILVLRYIEDLIQTGFVSPGLGSTLWCTDALNDLIRINSLHN